MRLLCVLDEVWEATHAELLVRFVDPDVARVLVTTRLKELLPPMPLIYLKAVVVDKNWTAASVGYLRDKDDT